MQNVDFFVELNNRQQSLNSHLPAQSTFTFNCMSSFFFTKNAFNYQITSFTLYHDWFSNALRLEKGVVGLCNIKVTQSIGQNFGQQKPAIKCEMTKQYTMQPTRACPLELSTHTKQNCNISSNNNLIEVLWQATGWNFQGGEYSGDTYFTIFTKPSSH
jgi:hypothetical protein